MTIERVGGYFDRQSRCLQDENGKFVNILISFPNYADFSMDVNSMTIYQNLCCVDNTVRCKRLSSG